MGWTTNATEAVRVAAVLGVAVAAGACAHVKQDDFDVSLESLREEMRGEIREGDERVSRDVGERVGAVERRVDGLERDLREIEREFGVTVERLESALRFHTPVHFGFDRAEVPPEGRAVLDRFGEVVLEYYPDAVVTIEGFTDPAGSREYNLGLGQRRAEAVRTYLAEEASVPAERIRAVSYGEDTARLVAPGQRGPGRSGWENRRVVMVVDHGAAVPARPVGEGGES